MSSLPAGRASAGVGGGGCTGDACTTREPWPLHHVKHRGVFVRLCTGCVLKYHPAQFCALCMDLLPTAPAPVIHCSSCPNVCHASCLPPSSSAASTDFFLCPSCSSTALDTSAQAHSHSRRRTLDLPYARSLLCAARLSAQSMARAAAAARLDADRKAKEAAAARKRACEMIDRVAAAAAARRDKDKIGRDQDQDDRQRHKVSGREREKWMRLHEGPFHDTKDKPPQPLPRPLPAAKFEQDDTKDSVARKPGSVSKGNPSS